MEEERPAMDERLVEGIKQLKTQKLVPIVNHTFLIADSAHLFTEKKSDLLFLPGWVCKMLSIKDKAAKLYAGRANKMDSQALFIYFVLAVGVICAGFYPILINSVPGTLYQRLYGRYLVNAVILLPIVFIETQRKITREMYSLKDALNPTTLSITYRNSLLLTIWNLCFCLSLQHTEMSSTLFFSSLMLLFWVLNKISRKASAISESEVNGTVILIIGLLIFGLKQWMTGFKDDGNTNLFQNHSLLGVIYAITASVAAGVFFISNHDITYYLPAYTSLLLQTLFSLVNLEILSVALRFMYPTDHPYWFNMPGSSLS